MRIACGVFPTIHLLVALTSRNFSGRVNLRGEKKSSDCDMDPCGLEPLSLGHLISAF